MDKTPLSSSFPKNYKVGINRKTLLFLQNHIIQLKQTDKYYRTLLLANKQNQQATLSFNDNLDHLLLFLSLCIKLKGETYHNLFSNKSKQLTHKLQYFATRIGCQRLHKVKSKLSKSTNQDILYQEDLAKTNFSILDIVNICNAIPFVLKLYIIPNNNLQKENEQLYIKAQEYFTEPLILTDLNVKILEYFVKYMNMTEQYSAYYTTSRIQNKLKVSKSYFDTAIKSHDKSKKQRVDFDFLCKMIYLLDCNVKFTLSTPMYYYTSNICNAIRFN
jgi:hypothetical protein